MDLASMSTLEMIGLGFLLWIGLIVLITVICIIYMKSPTLKIKMEKQRRIWFPSDEENERFNPEWMDRRHWEETR